MAKKDTNITTKFTSDIKELKNGISQAKSQLKLANAEFKAATSAVDYAADSVDGYQTNIEHLSKILKSQNDILEGYQKELKLVEETQGENSTAAIKLRTEIANQQAAVNKTAKEIAEYEKKLDDAANGADDLAEATKEASEEIEDASEGFTVLKGVLADLASSAIKSVIDGTKDMITSLDNATAQLMAVSGAGEEAREEIKDVLNTIYADNFGDSMEAVAEAVTKVKNNFQDLTSDELIDITEKAITLEDVFGMDLNESLRGAKALMNSFGLSSEEAFDLLSAGAQNGLNYSDELGDNLAEYAGTFAQAGYSAKEYFQLLTNGAQNGAYNLDKVNDSINEATTRLEDDTISDALSLFSTDTQDLFKEWQNGEASQKDVINSLVKDIADCTNEQKKATMSATVFGTMAEDGNYKVIESLTTLGETYSDVEGVANELAELKYDTIESSVESLGRTIKVEILQPIADDLAPVVKGLVGWLSDNLPTIKALVVGLAAATATYLGYTTAITVMTKGWMALEAVQKAVTVAQNLMNIAMNANPIGIIIALIAGLVTAFITLWNTSDEFRAFWSDMWEATKLMVSDAWDAITGVITGAWDGIKSAWDGVGDFFSNLWDGIKSGATTVFDALGGIMKGPINFLIDGINQVIEGLNGIAIPDWVPGIGGNSLNIPLIPRLEKGGILKKGEVGLLEGNGSEAVVPLDKNQKWIAAVARDMKAAGVGASKANSSSNTYNYNQYNNSPKALSRLEIYRQTQNLLDFAK